VLKKRWKKFVGRGFPDAPRDLISYGI